MHRTWTWVVLAGALVSAGCAGEPSPEDKVKQSVLLYKEGVSQLAAKKLDEGIDTLRKAYDLNPSYSQLRRDLAQVLLQRARRTENDGTDLMVEARRLREKSDLEGAKRKDKEVEETVKRERADLAEAVTHLSYLYDATPQDSQIPLWRSEAEAALGDFKTAQDDIRRAIEIGNPTPPQLDKLRGLIDKLRDAELKQQRLSAPPPGPRG